MSTKQSAALLDLLVVCCPDDSVLEHEHQVATILLSEVYQDLAKQEEFKTSFNQEFSADKLRQRSEKELESIPLRLHHEQLIRNILLSEDYQVLACRDAFQPWFDELFSEEKIRQYSAPRLKEVAVLLPQISLCLDNIIFSLSNGAGPTLVPSDTPNFSDSNSMARLNKKLDQGTGKNYTNIDPDDFMKIFDEKTVKSAGEHFQQLPVDCKDYKAALTSLLGPRKFCISDQELQELEAEYSDEVAQAQAVLDAGKGKRGRRRVVKAFIGLGALLIPSLFAGATGLLSVGAISMCTLGELVLVVTFWLRG